MNKNKTNVVLKSLLKNAEINVDKLLEFINEKCYDFESNIQVILFITNNINEVQLCKNSIVDNFEAKLLKVRLFNTEFSQVEYEYDEDVIKFFKTQEDANKYQEEGTCWKLDYKNNCDEEYNISSSHTFHRVSYTSIEKWIEGSKGLTDEPQV